MFDMNDLHLTCYPRKIRISDNLYEWPEPPTEFELDGIKTVIHSL